MMNKRVGFSPDVNDNQPVIRKHYGKQGYYGGTKVCSRGNKKRIPRSCSSSSAGFSAVRLLKRVGAKVAKAIRLISSGKKCSRKVSSASSSSLTLARSRSYAETLDDSQRAEAIEDCIEFLNSSSSLQRSNSVASSC
ncbi:hypothetical protein ACH5RR_004957 [Cinchona calisaya]|uniref:Josephin-like protein n=1 Tax=Cinchona calisaya TaxID=153742 RepID=A0ABD3AZH0_9GENT